jgi:type IV secretory pathway VirB4 component
MNRTKKEKVETRRLTAQDTIGYKRIFEDGIIEIEKGVYSKSISFTDINYQIAKQCDQETIFKQYSNFLNSFDPSVKLQITINNKNINENTLNEDVLLNYKNDELDEFRKEYNEMLIDKLSEGRNNLAKEKYMTITINANNIHEARTIFSRIINEAVSNLKEIGSNAKVIEAKERLQILSDFLNTDEERKIENLKKIKKRGLTSKDEIAPTHFYFRKDYFEMGKKFGRALFLKDTELPAHMVDTFISDLTDINNNMLLTINIRSVNQAEALQTVQRQLTGMNSNKIESQRRAIKNGYSPDIIPYELQHSLDDAEKLLNDLRSKNQKMFLVSILITHVANSLNELNETSDLITSIANKHICRFSILNYQQEDGLTSTLPLGNDKLKLERTLTSESTAIFMPFTNQELFSKQGCYYGVNALSKNLLMFDRKTLKNGGSYIVGASGGGKSMLAKKEIINALLRTEDTVIIIDPEKEYTPLVEEFGGEVIYISASSTNYINPLDMNKNYGDNIDPIKFKSDFFVSFVENLIGGKVTAGEKSILDRCLRLTYADYDFTKENTPTLKDFMEILKSKDEPEAKKLALELEIYIDGSLNVFANKTNVDLNKRLIVFNTHYLGGQLKTVGMSIVLDFIWNTLTQNKKNNKYTHIYIDEIYLLFNNEHSSMFLEELYKRARKWGGLPTGITQNVEDLLSNPQARKMFGNAECRVLLNLAPNDRKGVAELLNISDSQLSYVTNAKAGSGLLVTEKGIIPFTDDFPKDTKLYDLINTDPTKAKPVNI